MLQNRAGIWQSVKSEKRHAKKQYSLLQGARVRVPVYRQQRPEDSKIGTQSAAKSRPGERKLQRR